MELLVNDCLDGHGRNDCHFDLCADLVPNLVWLVQVVFLLAMMGLNLFVVSAFGKAETVMTLIKIFAILALIVIGIIMVIMHYKSPSGHVASFMNVLGNFKMFPNGAAQFIFAFPMVFFAFQGIEFVGITTAETKNPR